MITDQLNTKDYKNKGRKVKNANPLHKNISQPNTLKIEQVVPANALLRGKL